MRDENFCCQKELFYLVPLIASVLVLGRSVCPSFCGSPWWKYTTWIVSPGLKKTTNKAMFQWLTRTEKAPDRPELPRLDGSIFIPLLALITWRWNKRWFHSFFYFYMQTATFRSTLGASPAKASTSCHSWGERRSRLGIWIYAWSSSYWPLEARVVGSCRSKETTQAERIAL